MARGIPVNKRTFYRGDDWVITVHVLKADGTPEDVGGWSSTLTFRKARTDADPPVLTASGTIVGAPTDGVLSFAVARAATLAVIPGEYACSVVRTNAGNVDTLIDGTTIVKLNIKDAAA